MCGGRLTTSSRQFAGFNVLFHDASVRNMKFFDFCVGLQSNHGLSSPRSMCWIHRGPKHAVTTTKSIRGKKKHKTNLIFFFQGNLSRLGYALEHRCHLGSRPIRLIFGIHKIHHWSVPFSFCIFPNQRQCLAYTFSLVRTTVTPLTGA